MSRKRQREKAPPKKDPENNGVVPVESKRQFSQWSKAVVVFLLLALFASLSTWEMLGDSATSDERVHLPAGYAYWIKREFRLNPEHPPLVKLLASAPLLAMNLRIPPTEPQSQEARTNESKAFNSYQETFGSEFLFTQDADRLLFWGRLPMVGLGLLLAFFVFWWSWKIHGDFRAGILSLFLTVLEPNILAHSHYVTTDVPVAGFSVMAMLFLWSFSQQGTVLHLFLASLGLGLALASKSSAIFLVPVFFFLLFFRWPAKGWVSLSFLKTPNSMGTRTLAAVFATFVILIVVQASYFFSPDLLLYFKGLQSVNANHIPDFKTYIHGNFFSGGVWWYPLYTWLLKTPLPTMISIILAGIFYLKTGKRTPKGLWFVLLPAAIYTLAVCAFADNLGVRYMIPTSVFLLVMAGGSLSIFTASQKTKTLGAILALWLVVSVLRVSPYYIAYFNELIGGPQNAPYYLDDSNIDWGQDLRRLMAYLEKHEIQQVNLLYWGPTPPTYYDSRYKVRSLPWTDDVGKNSVPPPGLYAISVNYLTGFKRAIYALEAGPPYMDWLARYTPTDRIGYSIYIYKFPQEPK